MRQLSISDDDLCATCSFCRYDPGNMSTCAKDFPATFDKDGYARECGEYAKRPVLDDARIEY